MQSRATLTSACGGCTPFVPGNGVGRLFGLIGVAASAAAAVSPRPATTTTAIAAMRRALPIGAGTDPDRFDVAELVDAVGGKLTAVTRSLHSTERQFRIRRRHAVDEHGAGVDVANEARVVGGLARPDIRAESENRRVGKLDRFVEVAYTKQLRHRPEHLLVAPPPSR